MRLREQVAIVTGAGQGIGKGIAKVLAREGARVVLATVSATTGKVTEEEIQQANGDALFVQTDVASEISIRSMVEQTVERYGRIDTLVNNAGITVFKPLLEATSEDWDHLMNINLRGYFLCSKYVLPAMIEPRPCSIINISSNHAFATHQNAEMYAASKGGINAMTQAMALSLGKHNIRVNAICPGFTETEHYRNWTKSEDITAQIHGLHALGRISKPEDIGELALYLASDDSRMMTGAELLIDAGLTARLYNPEQF